MSLQAGTRIGTYEITGSLGEGGMGEVYRARDKKLDRDVAVKILPRLLADDPERRVRFDREARALASLNHPNIAMVYGAEDADGTVAIVMELVEGEDLAARITRGPLRWAEAQPIARQIADALDAAHERGIVHRDLKPANIRITPDERVKILDFGLAKAVGGSDALAADPALSPTLTSPSTRLGTIVGTAAYMAPEQAKGRAVDKRADIWAFGVVVFEMLTGYSPFRSDSAVESLSLVISKDPDWKALPPSVPPHVGELLQRCLVKDPKGRLRDIGDALPVLERTEAAPSHSSGVRGTSNPAQSVRMAVAALVLSALAAIVAWSLKPLPSVPLRQLALPEAMANSDALVISPDGSRIAYLSDSDIHVRQLDAVEPQRIAAAPPTTSYLVWSPDSAAIGFYAQGTIRTVPAAGGPVFTVTRVPASGQIIGIAWHPDGSIVFAVWRDSLYRVAATGGDPEVLVQVNAETEVDFHEIANAPGGRLLVGVHMRAENLVRTELIDTRTKSRVVLVENSTVRDFRHTAEGLLLFRRIGTNEGLWALPFAETGLDIAKSTLVSAGASDFSVAEDGTLVVRSEAPPTFTLEWISRDGSAAHVAGPPLRDLFPWVSLSPDGSRVAYISGRTDAGLFVRDLSTGADTRLTSGGATGENVMLGSSFMLLHPSWVPDGTRVLYTKGAIEASQLITQRADGAGGESAIGRGSFGRISADGKWLLWLEDIRGRSQLRYAALDGARIAGEARAVPGMDDHNIRWFDLTSDGRLLAYSTREGDMRSNVYLTEFPDAGARWQVTTAGGTYPQFSREGTELIFLTGAPNERGEREGRLMVLPVTRGPAVKLGVPRALLTGETTPSGFDIAGDGRLLAVRRVPVSSGETARAVLVQNWPLLIRR